VGQTLLSGECEFFQAKEGRMNYPSQRSPSHASFRNGKTPGHCPPFDLHGLKTYDLQSRPSKAFIEDAGQPVGPEASLGEWIDSLPRCLGAADLRRVRDHIVRANCAHRPVVAALGGHVIKTGCGPYLVDWVRRGIVQAVVLNGAAAIHDFELALAGKTSEDVAGSLHAGKFGMARETADAFAVAAQHGARDELGLGWALGKHLTEQHCPHGTSSLVLAAYETGIPCTIHVALGTDIVHMHPHVSGAALGEASMIDFRRLCTVVAQMAGGVWLNLGSAVVLPEVFLKAVSVVRNFGHDLDGLVCVTVDKQSHYRNRVNVLERPASEGIELIGHHELLLPLLHAAVAQQLAVPENQQPAQAA
jgi:deoxyhypusine synthase